MNGWTFPPPTPSGLGDHDVPAEGARLAGRRVALLVTGGIAAMKIPFVARALRRQGAAVVAFTSKEALRYVTVDALEWSTVSPVVQRLTPAAEHLSDAAPFDAYLLAPATYNSINKVAAGVADGVVTAAFASALGRLEAGRTAVLVAPTMHGSLHNRILVESLRRLHDLGVRVVPPRDAYGKHNLPDEAALVAEVCRAVSRSPLRGRRVLVTGGIAIASELHHRGAEVMLVLGEGASQVPSFVPRRVARTHDEQRSLVQEELGRGLAAGVLAADVADLGLAHPDLHVIALERRGGIPHEELIAGARARLDRVDCVVASLDEEPGAWMVTRTEDPRALDDEGAVATALADHLEKALAPPV